MAAGSSRASEARPNGASSVSAAVAAATENADSVSSYKRKLFFRRLKVVLMALIALTLLLLGCLLGFVLPASLELKGQERANATLQDRRNSSASVAKGNMTDIKQANVTIDSVTTSLITEEIKLQPSSETPVTSTSTQTETTTDGDGYPTKGPRTSKWWILNIHDKINEVKRKYTQQSSEATPKSTDSWNRHYHGMPESKWKFTQQDETTTLTPVIPENETTTAASESSGSTTPSYVVTTHIKQWWRPRWKEYLDRENNLQNRERNSTSKPTISSAPLIRANDGERRIQQHFDRRTNLSMWEDSKNQLLRNNANQTARPNVRIVTSYPKRNLTTSTVPSIVTRVVFGVTFVCLWCCCLCASALLDTSYFFPCV